MKRLSIGSRLTLWYFAIFAVAQLLFGAAMWWLVRYSVYDVVQDAMEGRVEGVRRFLESQPPDATLARLQHEASELYSLEVEGDYLQIGTSDGSWIYRSKAMARSNVPALTSPVPDERKFSEVLIDGQPVLMMSSTVKVYGHTYFVETASPLHESQEALTRYKWNLVWFAPLILLAASVVGYWVSHRALAPVDRITQAARRISAGNLGDRLEPLPTGDELQRLSDTLNQMLARLEASFKSIAQFTADASHELRTPVSLIRTEAELALRKPRTEAEYRETLRQVHLEAERTTGLIEALLALARADSGTHNLHLRDLDVAELLREVSARWSRTAEAAGLQVARDIPPGERRIQADPGGIRRVLDILFDNALKYTPAPGTITVSLASRAQAVIVRVSDTGIGIAAEDRANVFKRFYRADRARHRESGGVGLGLAIAHWIVTQHGGAIEVESAPGKGSTFSVVLPRQPEPASAAVAPREEARVSAAHRNKEES